jgi:hypothetical protein
MSITCRIYLRSSVFLVSRPKRIPLVGIVKIDLFLHCMARFRSLYHFFSSFGTSSSSMSIATKTEERNGTNQDQEGRDISPSAKINLSPSAKNNHHMSTFDHPAGVPVSAPTAENEAVENNDSNLIHKLIHKMVSPVTVRRVFGLLSFSFCTRMCDALMFDFLINTLKTRRRPFSSRRSCCITIGQLLHSCSQSQAQQHGQMISLCLQQALHQP